MAGTLHVPILSILTSLKKWKSIATVIDAETASHLKLFLSFLRLKKSHFLADCLATYNKHGTFQPFLQPGVTIA